MDEVLRHWTGGAYLILALVAGWEALAPRRAIRPDGRWLHNGLLFGCLLACGRLLVPAGLVGVAALAQERGGGLLPGDALWLHVAVAVLGFDLLRYGEHRLMHGVPLLWRLHRTHHTDTEVDFTTSLRFHPLELAVELGVKSAAILALGVAPLAVALHELFAVAANTFTHGNVRVPTGLERRLRAVLVTPDMHRVHHSRDAAEHGANFGAAFSFWDRLFGTYVAQPSAGHRNMALGVDGFTSRRHRQLHWMLLDPLLGGDASAGRSSAPVTSAPRDLP